ncbi:MAG: hypothetical protein C3F07_06755 [Anaerolineales bacterium]|nr:LamG domain-containing protein [Anaerolineae bacterium]PWB74860.1 MAG: hypothetical protein C3F07_06755 [Anaerolineales bacterium]
MANKDEPAKKSTSLQDTLKIAAFIIGGIIILVLISKGAQLTRINFFGIEVEFPTKTPITGETLPPTNTATEPVIPPTQTPITPMDTPTTTPEIQISGEVWAVNIDEPHIYRQFFASARKITNFSLEADIIINEPTSEFHGLMFRAQDDDDQFYSFRITQEGQFAFDLWEESSDHTFRRLVGPLRSQVILTGVGRINHLKVVVIDSNFDLFINGQKVSTITDETYPTGRLGFVSCTCDGSENASATFSNLLAVIFP